jgi:hypothetical protein
MIRSYGPGKFIKVIDSYAYKVTLDDGADREESYDEGGGWYGFIDVDPATRNRIREIAKEEGDTLTAHEEDLLDYTVAIILFERSDGIVEVDWYDERRGSSAADDAEAAWEEIEELFADEEEEEEEEDEDDEGDE